LQIPAATKVVQYQSPIKRVVTLLRKMHEELEHEAKHEAEMYDKMVCWCETNEKEKTKAIQDADAKDKALTSEIESRSARLGSVTTEIDSLKKEIGELTESLKTATSIREKGAKEFADTETSLTQALTNVKNAIVILSKHNSLLQLNTPLMMGMKTVLRDLAFKHELLTASDVTQRRVASLRTAFISLGSDSERASAHQAQRMNRELLKALDVQSAGDDTLPLKFAERLLTKSLKAEPSSATFLQLDKKPPGPASYAPQSNVVYGILNQLKSDFEATLARSQEDEKKDIAEFEDISQGKEAQIDASKKKLDELEDENGDNLKALSDAKEDLEQTRNQRSADVKFLTNLKKTCQDLDNQWQVRSKTRSEELTAVAEALAIITKDDNADLLRTSVSFLQVQEKKDFEDNRRSNAANVLRNAFDGASDLLSAWEGRHGGAPVVRVASDSFASSHKAIAALTVRVQIDSFTKVKASIDALAAELKKQQKTEVEFKARCVKDLNANKKAVLRKTDEKEDLEASLEEMSTHLKTLTKEINDARDEIAETELEVKKASQNRETQNTQFQSVVADQRATQDILKKALAKLKGFYTSGKKQEFLETEASQVPPAQFSAYRDNAGSSPAIGMIEQIIQDSTQLEHECMDGEKKAQADYEKFVKDSNALIKTLSDGVVEKTTEIASTKSSVADSKGDLESTKGEIDSLGKVEDDLHQECAFTLKNFEIRQTARAKEIEALHAAKAILSTGTVRS